MNLISVYKSPTVDRTVWDRRRRNYLEQHLKGAASDMPAGYDLTDIEVPNGHYAHSFCDDVSEMYPSFIAPPSRARSNAIAIEFTRAECQELTAFKRIARIEKKVGDKLDGELSAENGVRKGGPVCASDLLLPAAGPYTSPDLKLLQLGNSGQMGNRFVPCAGSLVMGDLNAVDFATGAHQTILERAEALPSHARIRHAHVHTSICQCWL